MPYSYRCFEYIIEAGDTYGCVARMFSIDEGELREFNQGAVLTQGARLKIPAQGGGCIRGVFYSIKRTDTLYRIARRYGVYLETLLAANPFLNPAYYLPGQIIIIPRTKKTLARYTLGKGERLVDVLKKYDMDLSMFCALNPGRDPLRLEAGQRVVVRKYTGCLYRRYTMKPGESIVSVAAKFGMTVGNLLGANKDMPVSACVPGTVLHIPLRRDGC